MSKLEPLCCPHLVEQWRLNNKNTHRERRLRVLPIGVASDLSNPQSLTQTALTRGRIWLRAFGPAMLFGCTPLTCGITALDPGYFRGCWFDQALSSCIRRFCSCILPATEIVGYALPDNGNKFLLLK